MNSPVTTPESSTSHVAAGGFALSSPRASISFEQPAAIQEVALEPAVQSYSEAEVIAESLPTQEPLVQVEDCDIERILDPDFQQNFDYFDRLMIKIIKESELDVNIGLEKFHVIFSPVFEDADSSIRQQLSDDARVCLENLSKIITSQNQLKQYNGGFLNETISSLFESEDVKNKRLESIKAIEKSISDHTRIYNRKLENILANIETIQTRYLLSPQSLSTSNIHNYKMHKLIAVYLGEEAANKYISNYVVRSFASHILNEDELDDLDNEIPNALRTKLKELTDLRSQDLNKLVEKYQSGLVASTIKAIKESSKKIFNWAFPPETRSWLMNSLRRMYSNYVLSFHTMGDWFQALLFSGLTQNLQINAIIQTVLKILNFIFAPLFHYYVELFADKERLIIQQRFSLFEKIKFSIKVAIPILLILLTFIHFEPFFNDFLLFFIIPACAALSIVLFKGLVYGFKQVCYMLGIIQEYSATERLKHLFGEKASLVAEFYEKQIGKLSVKIDKLSKILPCDRTDGEDADLKALIEKFNELKQEWYVLSEDRIHDANIKAPKLRQDFLARLALIIQPKIDKQKKAVDFAIEGVACGEDMPPVIVTPVLPMLDVAFSGKLKIMSRYQKLEKYRDLMQSVECYGQSRDRPAPQV